MEGWWPRCRGRFCYCTDRQRRGWCQPRTKRDQIFMFTKGFEAWCKVRIASVTRAKKRGARVFLVGQWSGRSAGVRPVWRGRADRAAGWCWPGVRRLVLY